MSKRRRPGKLTVALASRGLTGCGDGESMGRGPVDPPPPPLECDTVDEGQRLSVTATLNADTLAVTIDQQDGGWTQAAVRDVVGASVVGMTLASGRILLDLRLDSSPPTSGSFRLEGELVGTGSVRCEVTRSFTFSVNGQTVTIALVPGPWLPLAARHGAKIKVVEQLGLTVELEARTKYKLPHRTEWTVTGGTIRASTGSRASWQLPSEPGLYQVEVVVDYGRDGLAVDWLPLEVT